MGTDSGHQQGALEPHLCREHAGVGGAPPCVAPTVRRAAAGILVFPVCSDCHTLPVSGLTVNTRSTGQYRGVLPRASVCLCGRGVCGPRSPRVLAAIAARSSVPPPAATSPQPRLQNTLVGRLGLEVVTGSATTTMLVCNSSRASRLFLIY